MRVGAEISRLLSHYWSTSEDQHLREAQAKDWLADLKEFPPEVVAEACGDWRRGETKRPMIADIRQRCFDVIERNRPVPAAPRPDTEKMRAARTEWKGKIAEAAAYREAWARGRGYKDFATALQSGACGNRR